MTSSHEILEVTLLLVEVKLKGFFFPQLYKIEKAIAKQQKMRSLVCAKERNRYAVDEIRRDFTAGIKV